MHGFKAVEENLRATLAVFGRAEKTGETRELPGVAVTSSGVQFSMFNSAVLTSPVETAAELERRLLTAAEFFEARRLGWSFWVCQGWIGEDLRKKVAVVFDRHRMHLVVELPGMAAERLAPPARPPAPVLIRRVSDAATRADFSRIMSEAFGIPMPVSQAVYEAARTWDGDFSGYVGYAEGLAVTSAATIVTPAALGVYAVGTLPGFQHRGYAEAVMRHAVAQAGVEPTVLQSSESGYSLYRKMGYRTVTRYAVFAS
jgi:ribosomal protein S18 acetylase RimI-like enzyme